MQSHTVGQWCGAAVESGTVGHDGCGAAVVPRAVGHGRRAAIVPGAVRHGSCSSIEKTLHQIRIVCYLLRPLGGCRFVHDRSVLVIDSSEIFLLCTFDITTRDPWHDLSDEDYRTGVVIFLVCILTHRRQNDVLEFIEVSFEILIHWIVGEK